MSLYVNMETRPWLARIIVAGFILAMITNALLLFRLAAITLGWVE